mgnify:CR=1 FL=1|tara:strand:- start:556 stop:756 length:201 start_codon:yes stop_codon:yes gene_type:complete
MNQTKNIIEALQLLEDFCARDPQKINHYKGTDEMGNYEYWSLKSSGTNFSSPNLHGFINDVVRRWK